MFKPHRKFTHSISLSILAATLCACGGQTDTGNASSAMQAAPASTAITFAGARNNYTVKRTTSGFEVKEINGGANSTVVAKNAHLKFTDMTLNLEVADIYRTMPATSARNLIELYVAFFNRVPDADGMVYWMSEIKNGMTSNQLANNFYNAAVQYPDLTGYSSNMSSSEFVKIIYKNVLGRTGSSAPSNEEVNYWAAELDSGRKSKGILVNTMLESAHSFAGNPTWGWVPQLLDNKITVGTYFAVEQGLGYVSPTDTVSKGIAIAALVKPDDMTAAKSYINVKDISFNLLSTTPPIDDTGSGQGDSRNCFNLELFKQGVKHYTEMTTTMRPSGLSESYAVSYSLNGTTNFKGYSALEFVADTLMLTGPSAGIKSQVKSYISVSDAAVTTYGSILSTKFGNMNYVVTNTMTPPEVFPFALALNQAYTQTYTVKQEMEGSTNVSQSSSTETLVFLGTETISVPAGNFSTCKIKHINTSNGIDTVSYTWHIADSSARGLIAKIEADDALTVATKVSITK
ncbi:DUF4214 domain-containing protein [Undibacterium fentianense]|uniref:DUF4214 domain-containing protein n=1 Tax=Undibacterium fentianense TaxID=2828728 RepID=A0A941E3F0_9BURK|nr:DUF4214 domain-containing protein [Undibacterium fentianense]MBR7800781.1 DUF4214 domain-containing protein [Undibacterium fentianense]